MIAFDLRGHGKSEKPPDPAKYGEEMVRDAIHLLDHLGIRRAHLVGYSLGAIISAALAAVNDVKALAAYQRGGSRAFNSTDAEVAAIKIPVVGIIGSLDNVASMRQLQTLLPSLKLVVIDGATHIGDRGTPRLTEFVASIREFIAAHPAAGR